MSVVSDGFNHERIIIFGGLSNEIAKQKGFDGKDAENKPKLLSSLTNKCYLLEVK